MPDKVAPAARAAKRSKEELFIEKAQVAVAKAKAAFLELQDCATKYKGHFTAEQKETIFGYIEDKLQVPTEQIFNDALAGKTAVSSDFSLAPVPAATPAT